MADQVRIKNGDRELTVSLKAFQTIYSTKGFTIVGGAPAAVETAVSGDVSDVIEGASAPKPRRRPAKRRAAKKSAAKTDDAVDSKAPEEG